ncbi:hypothetical protein GWI33_013912 [Rhynchophorus ferrugineus]|uniref:Uncharacterized protein n=1 Tax=Rhynchophorus ferrugineus TaxID=354439 RepID=A0A834I2I8_RHYFE|nr:hypothetical protein GWI33_013912 [Rhynchophorus ferrugineus]
MMWRPGACSVNAPKGAKIKEQSAVNQKRGASPTAASGRIGVGLTAPTTGLRDRVHSLAAVRDPQTITPHLTSALIYYATRIFLETFGR